MAEIKRNIMTDGRKVISKNRKAHRDYLITDRYDAGLVLLGSEIKSIRAHRINIGEGFVQEKDRELWLMNTHIAPYEQARHFGHTDPRRPRKALAASTRDQPDHYSNSAIRHDCYSLANLSGAGAGQG